MAPPGYLIVWDLDRTLGVFDGLERLRTLTDRIEVSLRAGIGDALDRLSEEGFSHTVLTLATPDYAELALRGTGLRHHFLEVACQGQRAKGDAEGIARTLGMELEALPARMLFVGDHVLFDAPQDSRVVFHLEPYALRRPAARLVELVLELREAGEGSLRAGFEAMAGPEARLEEIVRAATCRAGNALLLPRAEACPVIAFDEDDSAEPERGDPVSFVPADVFPTLADRLGPPIGPTAQG